MTNDYENNFFIDNAEFSIVEDFTPTSMSLPANIYQKLQSIKTKHAHTAFEVFFISDEPLTFVTTKDTREYKNQILIVPPFLEHYTINSEKTHRFLFAVKHGERSIFSFLSDAAKQNVILVTPSSSQIDLLVKQLFESRLHLKKSDAYRLSTLYKLLFLELYDCFNKDVVPNNSIRFKQQCDYAETINYILTNQFMNEITLSYVAQELHLSPKQTARIISRVFNTTLSSLLIQRRLSVAALYLAQTKIKISEIIELVGFQTENYFFSKFKETFGVTPLAYRARHQPKR